MRRLFWKIFAWFWGAMVLIAVALYLLVLTTRPDPLPRAWRDTASAVVYAYASAAAAAYEQNGSAALNAYLNGVQRTGRGRFWFLDTDGHQLFGTPLARRRPGPEPPPEPPPGGEPPPAGEAPPPPPRGALWGLLRPHDRSTPPALDAGKVDELRRAVSNNDDTVFQMEGPGVLVAQSVPGPSHRRYTLVGTLPRPQFGRPAADPSTQWLGMLVVLGMSSLVCYGLVWYLTSPLVALRTATHRLAAGDLAARTNASRQRRRDEVADLGRDFDTMAERIQGLVNAQGQLLGDISHELRSPLARLSMALALARRYATSGAATDELPAALDRIGRETTRLNALIGQLLELTRLESGEAATEHELVDLCQVVQEVVADADFEARSTDRCVRVVQTEPCSLNGNRALLHSAVENVVRNAIRYTAPGAAVEVSLQIEATPHDAAQPGLAVIRVRDRGPGVPDGALSELFRPFYRVDTARDRASGGVGLGLAITERAVRSHGGTARAENAADGGLLIELRLPLGQAENRSVL